ncbi:MAG: UPF0175 family protein [Nanoarchaeota archaeon]
MTEAIGIRLDDETLTKVDSISKEEDEDRSTVIRKLITRGYKEIVKEKASEDYRAGRVTLSEAAHRAGLTVWDMESYLVQRGFKSQYSVEDLMIESAGMARARKR